MSAQGNALGNALGKESIHSQALKGRSRIHNLAAKSES